MLKFSDDVSSLKSSIRQKVVFTIASKRIEDFKETDSYAPMTHTGDEWYQTNRLIYHAAGGVDGMSYTNSREALEQTLLRGNRIIEIDFAYTSDGHLVCVHDWNGISQQSKALTLDAYRQLRIYGKYTPLTAEELLAYMREYEDLYIVFDTKESNANQVVLDLIELCGEGSSLPDRFIIQLYSGGNKQILMDAYPFKDENFLFTAYKFGTENPIKILELCYRENISVITAPQGSLSADAIELFAEKGFILFEHTVNRPDEANKALQKGVYGLYTDFLWPDDLNIP